MKYAIIDIISCESCPFHNHLRVPVESSWCIAPYLDAPREIKNLSQGFPNWCPLDDDDDE